MDKVEQSRRGTATLPAGGSRPRLEVSVEGESVFILQGRGPAVCLHHGAVRGLIAALRFVSQGLPRPNAIEITANPRHTPQVPHDE